MLGWNSFCDMHKGRDHSCCHGNFDQLNHGAVENFEPQPVRGLWDLWLSLVEFGPTQAERVLIHSSMLEMAHERRFVVSEMGLDFSRFENEHSERVQHFVSDQQSRFYHHSSCEPSPSRGVHEHDLVGLAPILGDIAYPPVFQLDCPPVKIPSHASALALNTSPARPAVDESERLQPDIEFMGVDSRSNSGSLEEAFLQGLFKHKRPSYGKHNPRTNKQIRLRKDPSPIVSSHAIKRKRSSKPG